MRRIPQPLRFSIALLAILLSVRGASEAKGQMAPVGPAERAVENVRERQPVYLRDKDGTLVPVIGFTPEDLDEFIALKHQIVRGQTRPRYSLQRLALSGGVTGLFARLKVECEVLVSESGWVRVPLRLPEAVLLPEPKYKGPTRSFTDYDGTVGGYSAWFFGGGEQLHHLTLEFLVPVERLSGKQRLKLTAPRSAQSEMKLSVPLADAEAAVSGGAILDPTARRSAATGSTSLVLRALDGEVEVTWWAAARRTVESAPDLEAVGTFLSKVDGRSVRTDGTLRVSSSSGEFRFDGFRVRVPPGANLLPSDQPGVRFHGPVNVDGLRVVDVSLDEPTLGPVDVRLSTETPFNLAKKEELVELAGCEVLDAIRQSGHIGVEVQDQWQIVIAEKQPGLRQVETLPDALRQADLVAGFEYSGTPCSLQARVFQRETRIAVEPEYEVRVEAGRIHLKARLKYRVPGTKVFHVNVDLRGWETEADRIGPLHLVDQDQVATQVLTPLTIPLQQPQRGEFELTLDAWKAIPRNAQKLDFYLPHPTAHNLVTSRLLILPADNVQLVPQADGLSGLKSQPLPRKYHVAGRQQEPIFFVGEESQGHFVAEFRVLPRTIQVAAATTVHLAELDARIEQTLSYKVAHETIDRLALSVPRSLAEDNQIEITLEGHPLPLTALPGTNPQGQDLVTMHVPLVDEAGKPTDRSGAFELLLRYAVPHEKLQPDTSTSLDVPLIMPGDGTLSSNQVNVVATAGLKAVCRPGAWNLSSVPPGRSDLLAISLEAHEPVANLPLAVQAESKASSGGTVIQRAWISSEVGSGWRQDRAVYRFTTPETSLRLTLPKQAVTGDAAVVLNGSPLDVTVGSDRRISVPLPNNATHQPQVVELSYRFVNYDRSQLNAGLEAPQLPDDVWVRRLYWQMSLPAGEHVLTAPAGFISESKWRFNGLYFGRQPLLSRAELEAWSGAERLSPQAESFAENVYLFSTLGPVERVELSLARRSWLVFGASLSALCIGLLMIYLPLVRRALLLVVVASLISLGLVYPEPLLMLLQAGSLGAVLVLLAGLLERLVAGRRSRALPLRRAASSILKRGAVHEISPLAMAGAHSSTRTAALAVPAAGPETSGS